MDSSLESVDELTNRVGNIVGTVGNGHHHCGNDLAVCEEMFDADVVALRLRVDGAQEVAVVRDNVTSNT